MTIDIYMPALSPTMDKGTLSKWLVSEGDSVSAGDAIAEIETDKATMEVESIDDGKLGRILIDEGTDDVPVGARIAVLLEEGEDDSALADIESSEPSESGATPQDEPEEKPEAAADAEPSQPEKSKPSKDEGETPAVEDDGDPTPPAPSDETGARIFASPLARRIAAQKGIDLAGLEGSGPKGRIVKADVEAAATSDAKPAKAPAAEAEPAAPTDFEPPADVPYEEARLSGMRKVIARRMTQSKTEVPHFYLTIDIALDTLLEQRKTLNARLAEEDEGAKLSVNDFLIRASALALKAVPEANAMYAGDKMLYFQRQDISVAVAVEGGLVTPVIRDAGSKGLAEISREMKTLAKKAQEGELTPEEYQGGTFSLSNLGMFGIREFAAVINPPQGAILAVGQGEKRPVVIDDAVAVRTMMTVTLAVDHRAMDGAIGARFLAALKRRLEDPALMLL